MICKNCGAEIADNALFCTNCGATVESDEVKENYIENRVASANGQGDLQAETGSNAKAIKILQLLVGTALIIVGFSKTGTSLDIYKETFGADFYTDVFEEIYYLAQYLVELKAAVGWVIVAIGAYIDFDALKK